MRTPSSPLADTPPARSLGGTTTDPVAGEEHVVVLDGADPALPARLAAQVPLAETPPADAVRWAARVGEQVPPPGEGRTAERWAVLAGVAARNLSWARTLEPHVDALAILREAGESALAVGPGGEAETWGVWAAEGGRGRLRATQDEAHLAWRLDGPKPWCSLAAHLERGLVTAWADDGSRRLLALDTRHPGVHHDEQPWASHGLRGVPTAGLVLDGVSAQPVGGPDWYLDRPGFWWGGLGVAAVWYGGAVALRDRLEAGARRREPDQLALAHLGAVDAVLFGARCALERSATLVDRRGPDALDRREGLLLAARVRQVVHDAAEEVLRRCRHGLGPGPLAQEEEHARRVSDLEVYLRQHHAERDQAALGSLLLGRGA